MARLPLLLIAATAALSAALLSDRGGAEPATTAAAARPARPAGTLVFMTRSNRLVAYDVAGGGRAVRRAPGAATCGPQLVVTGGHVVFAGVRRGRTVVFSMPISLDRPARRLGAAHAFTQSATDGRVWLAGTDCDRAAMVGVREVDVDGRVAFSSRRRVPGQWLAGAASGGLVLHRGRRLVLWDPARASSGRRLLLDDVSATRGATLAGCAGDCRDLVVVDTASGREVTARPPGGARFEPGARFSPDGSLLAAPVATGRGWRVVLVRTRDGASRTIPGSRVGAWPELSWSASSGWLFFRPYGRRVRAYRPGAPRAVRLPLRPPRGAIGFAAG